MSETTYNYSTSILTCPICECSGDIKIRHTKNGYNIYRCDDCKLLFVHPRPSTHDLLEIYNESYFKRGNKYKAVHNPRQRYNYSYNDEQKIIIINKYYMSGKLLDVGCAMGDFLYRAKQEAFDVMGVEISSYCADYVRNDLGINVHNGDLLSARLPSNAYDVVTLWDVIEHLENPFETLNEINRVLRPGGILCLSTGDAGSLYARVTGRFWHLLTPPQHLLYFNPENIGKILSRSGFVVNTVVHSGKYATVDFILFKARETFGAVVLPFQVIAGLLGLGSIRLYINIRDIMTCVAEKR